MYTENQGILASIGIILLGNIIKSSNRHIGNFVQGFGIGTGSGTIAHIVDKEYPNDIPHHDLLGLISIPIIFTIDKTGIIKNETIVDNLYGISIGVLTQHLLTEGCSMCGTTYCTDGDSLC